MQPWVSLEQQGLKSVRLPWNILKPSGTFPSFSIRPWRSLGYEWFPICQGWPQRNPPIIWLVVDLPLWKILVSWGYYSPNIWKKYGRIKQPTNNSISGTLSPRFDLDLGAYAAFIRKVVSHPPLQGGWTPLNTNNHHPSGPSNICLYGGKKSQASLQTSGVLWNFHQTSPQNSTPGSPLKRSPSPPEGLRASRLRTAYDTFYIH